MKWRHAIPGVLVLMAMTGCPSEFGKNGRVSNAVHNDALEISRKQCTQAKYDELCGGDKRYTARCIEECGG